MATTLRGRASRRTVAALLVMVGASACRQTEPTPQAIEPAPASPVASPEAAAPPADRGLEGARAWLKERIEGDRYLNVRFDGEPVDLTSPVTIDFEHGSGHGGNLVFVRLSVDQGTTRCERLTYQVESLGRPKTLGGTASRADVPTTTVRPLLHAVRALSTASVSARPRDWVSGSSNDFFVLVRVCGADGRDDRTWEFAGYSSSSEAFRYTAIRAVLFDRARETFESLPWKSVPTEEFRSTHFSDAFARNRTWYGTEFHAWVLDRSCDALAWFGNRSALPTLAWLRDHGEDVGHGRALRARWAIDDPGEYLEGPPPAVRSR
jgi:hypothetical protein